MGRNGAVLFGLPKIGNERRSRDLVEQIRQRGVDRIAAGVAEMPSGAELAAIGDHRTGAVHDAVAFPDRLLQGPVPEFSGAGPLADRDEVDGSRRPRGT
jgi:hypothetical protein